MAEKNQKTLDQQIAEEEARLKRLKQRREQQETGRKIITGAVVIEAARNDPATRKWLIDELRKGVTRKKDRERIKPLVQELKALDQSGDSQGASTDSAGAHPSADSSQGRDQTSEADSKSAGRDQSGGGAA